MRVMSKYCKAYTLSRLREFDGWDEHARVLKKKEFVNGEEKERELQDSDILFLQEDFTREKYLKRLCTKMFKSPLETSVRKYFLAQRRKGARKPLKTR